MPDRSQHGDLASLPILEGTELANRVKVLVEQRIGGGTSGRVFKASLDGKPAALKVMHPTAARREDAVSSFLKEAHLLSRLVHGNIIKILALCQLPPAFHGLPTRRYTWGLLMELMEGPLTTLIRNSQPSAPVSYEPQATAGATPDAHATGTATVQFVLPPDASSSKGYTDVEAVGWCLDLARALDFLHSQRPPIVHRDVKTENVLLTEPSASDDGGRRVAKLADFGLHVVLDSTRPISGLRRRSSSAAASSESIFMHMSMVNPTGSHMSGRGLLLPSGSRRPSDLLNTGSAVCTLTADGRRMQSVSGVSAHGGSVNTAAMSALGPGGTATSSERGQDSRPTGGSERESGKSGATEATGGSWTPTAAVVHENSASFTCGAGGASGLLPNHLVSTLSPLRKSSRPSGGAQQLAAQAQQCERPGVLRKDSGGGDVAERLHVTGREGSLHFMRRRSSALSHSSSVPEISPGSNDGGSPHSKGSLGRSATTLKDEALSVVAQRSNDGSRLNPTRSGIMSPRKSSYAGSCPALRSDASILAAALQQHIAAVNDGGPKGSPSPLRSPGPHPTSSSSVTSPTASPVALPPMSPPPNLFLPKRVLSPQQQPEHSTFLQPPSPKLRSSSGTVPLPALDEHMEEAGHLVLPRPHSGGLTHSGAGAGAGAEQRWSRPSRGSGTSSKGGGIPTRMSGGPAAGQANQSKELRQVAALLKGEAAAASSSAPASVSSSSPQPSPYDSTAGSEAARATHSASASCATRPPSTWTSADVLPNLHPGPALMSRLSGQGAHPAVVQQAADRAASNYEGPLQPSPRMGVGAAGGSRLWAQGLSHCKSDSHAHAEAVMEDISGGHHGSQPSSSRPTSTGQSSPGSVSPRPSFQLPHGTATMSPIELQHKALKRLKSNPSSFSQPAVPTRMSQHTSCSSTGPSSPVAGAGPGAGSPVAAVGAVATWSRSPVASSGAGSGSLAATAPSFSVPGGLPAAAHASESPLSRAQSVAGSLQLHLAAHLAAHAGIEPGQSSPTSARSPKASSPRGAAGPPPRFSLDEGSVHAGRTNPHMSSSFTTPTRACRGSSESPARMTIGDHVRMVQQQQQLSRIGSGGSAHSGSRPSNISSLVHTAVSAALTSGGQPVAQDQPDRAATIPGSPDPRLFTRRRQSTGTCYPPVSSSGPSNPVTGGYASPSPVPGLEAPSAGVASPVGRSPSNRTNSHGPSRSTSRALLIHIPEDGSGTVGERVGAGAVAGRDDGPVARMPSSPGARGYSNGPSQTGTSQTGPSQTGVSAINRCLSPGEQSILAALGGKMGGDDGTGAHSSGSNVVSPAAAHHSHELGKGLVADLGANSPSTASAAAVMVTGHHSSKLPTIPAAVAMMGPLSGPLRTQHLSSEPGSHVSLAARSIQHGGGSCYEHSTTSLTAHAQSAAMQLLAQRHDSMASNGPPGSDAPSEWQGWTNVDDGLAEFVYALTGRAGTSLYMAPEIVREELYNEKIDVYSFGVVMYEVFGRTLLLANRSREELEALSSRMAAGHRPRRVDRISDDGVWRLITACWAQDPVLRPPMSQVVAELAAISQSLVEAGSVGTPTQRGPLAARTMSRAFNISLKSRATSASQRSRVSKGISQDGRASSSAQTGGQHADSPERLSHTAQAAVDALLEPPPPPGCGPCGCVIC